MNGVNEIYSSFANGMDMPPTPKDASFEEVWETYTSVVHMVGTRFFEKKFGTHVEAANEVRLHCERHLRVSRLSEGMPLLIPASATRGLRLFGKYLEETKDVGELGRFLKLNAGIADRFAEYAKSHRGRAALPVMYALSVVARSAVLMSECVDHELKVLTFWGL